MDPNRWAISSQTWCLVASAKPSALTNAILLPASAAAWAVAAVRYQPAVAVRRSVGAFS